jgi:hypothetical protein
MAREQAGFALAYGVPPSEFRHLTQLERQAFHEEARRLKRKR